MDHTLKNIEIAYLFAKDMKHGINRYADEMPNWQLFEPSRFIYAYFSFNMLYDIDWVRTIDKYRILTHPGEIKTGKKINHLVNFIHDHSNDVYTKLSTLNYDKIIENAKGIKPDRNIKRTDLYVFPRNSFFENYKHAIQGLRNKDLDADNHYRLMAFCNQIRNNIFHGAKTISHMQMKEQRIRLMDYTNIILGTIEILYQIIEKELDYRRCESHDMTENILATNF